MSICYFLEKKLIFFNEIEMKMKLFNQKRLEMKIENENFSKNENQNWKSFQKWLLEMEFPKAEWSFASFKKIFSFPFFYIYYTTLNWILSTKIF